MKYLILFPILVALLAPSFDRFIVSSASCNEVWLQWEERSVELDPYTSVYIAFVRGSETQIYQGEYFHLSPTVEWWWTSFNGQGKTWTVRGYAVTNTGIIIDTLNSIVINCALQPAVWLPLVIGR